jgi:uncharacterized protein (TIGR00369 family)
VANGFFWDAVEAGRSLCPAGEMLGWKVVEIDAAQRSLRVQFEARRDFLNPAGVVQGGVLAAMLDETLSPALAAFLEQDEFPSTLEMKVNFVSPAKLGALFGEARVVSMGRTICFVEGKLSDAQGRLVATGTATALVQRKTLTATS